MSPAWIPLVFVTVTVLAYWYLGRRLPDQDTVDPPENSSANGGWGHLRNTTDRMITPHVPASIKQWLERRLSIAGYPGGFRVGSFLIVWLAVVIVGTILYLMFRSQFSGRLGPAIAWNLYLLIVALPYIYLYRVGTKRKRRIEKSLPDLLDRLDIAVNVGLPFTTGMEKVLQYMPAGPLTNELGQAMSEMRYGKSLEEAFRGVALRVRIPEISSFISSVVQAHNLGVDISQVIRNQAESIRVQHRQHAEEEAAKAGTKLIFPLMLVTLPMVFILLLGPVAISILWR